ncbi:MAG: VIT1/CCC1 transporter family protein [Simkaniaceae bacterium]|nr:VIT1/CCC1 transporter family protein [Simkaniaceae bacterium]
MDHFKGKTVPEHLIEARKKGAAASAEIHGSEVSGFLFSACDCLKEGIVLFTIVYLLSGQTYLIPFSIGYLIFKVGRSARLGWSRLERLHRLIKEEKYEIEHHRDQEREELTAIYEAKGVQGKLLTDLIDVLMADDNRLLQVMLQDELGLSLETYEHPIKQAFGAFLGAFAAALLGITSLLAGGTPGLFITVCILTLIATLLPAQKENNNLIKAAIWSIGISFLAIGIVYFL